jgi:hypothetical protein
MLADGIYGRYMYIVVLIVLFHLFWPWRDVPLKKLLWHFWVA